MPSTLSRQAINNFSDESLADLIEQATRIGGNGESHWNRGVITGIDVSIAEQVLEERNPTPDYTIDVNYD
jgi:hypothetical protein